MIIGRTIVGHSVHREHQAKMTIETGRVKAFSDGVFAIAITLLILEIKVPRGTNHTLTRERLQQWPSYLAFLLSFLFIGVMWIKHHRLFYSYQPDRQCSS